MASSTEVFPQLFLPTRRFTRASPLNWYDPNPRNPFRASVCSITRPRPPLIKRFHPMEIRWPTQGINPSNPVR